MSLAPSRRSHLSISRPEYVPGFFVYPFFGIYSLCRPCFLGNVYKKYYNVKVMKTILIMANLHLFVRRLYLVRGGQLLLLIE